MLTEGWATAYFATAAGVLLFALGIPALVLRTTEKEHISAVMRMWRYWWRLFWPVVAFALFLLVLCILLLWHMHPTTSAGVSHDLFLLEAAMSVVLVLAVAFAIGFLSVSLEQRVMRVLRRDAVGVRVGLRKRLHVHEEPIGLLISIGRSALAGHEKTLVLKAIRRIVTRIQNTEGYVGDQLEVVLRSFDEIVTSEANPGNAIEYGEAISIMEAVLETLKTKGYTHQHDCTLASRALQNLGSSAVRHGVEGAAVQVLRTAGQDDQVLFSLGRSAVQAGVYEVALAALNRLESLALHDSEAAPFYLGLVAHLWMAGPTAKREAQRSLAQFKSVHVPPLVDSMKRAADYAANFGDFLSADKLEATAAECTMACAAQNVR